LIPRVYTIDPPGALPQAVTDYTDQASMAPLVTPCCNSITVVPDAG